MLSRRFKEAQVGKERSKGTKGVGERNNGMSVHLARKSARGKEGRKVEPKGFVERNNGNVS